MKPLDALEVTLDGTKLIEASAGTGKTHAITTLFLRLLLEKRLDVDRILVVTFTKAATAELKTRIRGRLRSALSAFETGEGEPEVIELVRKSRDRRGDRARLVEALGRVDEAAVSTIHGFCQRALSENAFESGLAFDLELIADQRALLRELVIDFRARELAFSSDARVAHLARRQAGIERWMRLANLAAAMPELVPVPAPASAPRDEAPIVARYLELRARAKEAWLGSKGEVARLLLDDRVMNQNSYKRDRVENWLDSLGALVTSSEPSLDGWFDQMKKFLPTTIRDGTRRGARTPSHAFFELCSELTQAHDEAEAVLDEWLLALEHRLIERARSELGERKLRAGIQSFDDLLLELLRALRAPRGGVLSDRLFERFPAALIDEFQDTDPVQYKIFRHVYRERGSLFLIGDPKQAIYGFRGADIFSYLTAAEDVGGAFTLSRNRRTDPSLVRATNTLFSRPSEPFVIEGIDFFPVLPGPDARDRLSRKKSPLAPFEIAFLPYEPGSSRDQKKERINKGWSELPRRIAGHVATLLDSNVAIDGRPLEPGDIAILTRTNNQAIELQLELRRLGIVSVLLGDKSVFDSPEATELARILRALSAPNDEAATNAALVTSVFGHSLNELAALREDEARAEALHTSFSRWHQLWERHGVMRAFRTLLREIDAPARVLASPGGERKLTNLLHLTELLHCAALAEHLGIAGLRRWFDEARDDPLKRDLAPDAQQLRLESDARAVKLTTMHKSKGLEYPAVFCPYLWDGTAFDEPFLQFHDPDALCTKLHLRKDRADDRDKQLTERERLAENMRLAYVALTRAKHMTSVVWGPFNTCEKAPLSYLLHPPELGSGRDPAQRVHELDGKTMLADLERLTRAEPLSFRVSQVQVNPGAPRRTSLEPTLDLRARPIARALDACYRTSSFSALVAQKHAVLSIPATEGRDLDENKTGAEAELLAADSDGQSVPLSAFPRGAKAGDALHTLLETIDFRSPDADTLETESRRSLERHGLDPSWTPILASAIAEVLRTPLLDPNGFALSDIAPSERLSELEFTLPVRGRLSPRALADAFGDLPAYADRLSRLDFLPLEGHMRGFIDLVIRNGDRFYVVDYKSNYLGARPRDYARARLEASMHDHDYVLQAHLYSVAVDRYLSRRLRDYRYERDFGGVLYLYLRGMHPSRGPETGVFFEKPPATRLAKISAALGGPPS